MEWIPRRAQFGLVAFSYATALAVGTILIVARYFQYVNHPDDVAAYGGMYAGGDLLLEVFIAGMLLVATFFLVLVISHAEAAYETYSKILLAVSVTAPVSIGLMAIPAVG